MHYSIVKFTQVYTFRLLKLCLKGLNVCCVSVSHNSILSCLSAEKTANLVVINWPCEAGGNGPRCRLTEIN